MARVGYFFLQIFVAFSENLILISRWHFWAKFAFLDIFFFQGENVQLQMELARLDRVKSSLTSELSRLSAEVEKCETLTIEHEELQELYQETEAKYQTMLTVNLIRIVERNCYFFPKLFFQLLF